MANKSFGNVSWLLGEPITNFCRSIVDDSVKANAEFQSDAGMSPKIIRRMNGETCKWCQALAGEYDYPNVPKDVYRRHDNCDCIVEFFPRLGKKQDVHTKKWYDYSAERKGWIERVEARLSLKGERNIYTAKDVSEIQQAIKEKQWFNVTTLADGTVVDGNELVDIIGMDAESARAVYEGFDRVFARFPQMIGEIYAPTIQSGMSSSVYASTQHGFGRGAIFFNKTKFSNSKKLQAAYISGVIGGYHPAGTDWKSIVVHEIGHCIDEYLTNSLHLNTKHRYISGDLRESVMKACGFTKKDFASQVSGYAAESVTRKGAMLGDMEWFAECFAEYICSSNPRPVAQEFGRQLEEIMRGVS